MFTISDLKSELLAGRPRFTDLAITICYIQGHTHIHTHARATVQWRVQTSYHGRAGWGGGGSVIPYDLGLCGLMLLITSSWLLISVSLIAG